MSISVSAFKKKILHQYVSTWYLTWSPVRCNSTRGTSPYLVTQLSRKFSKTSANNKTSVYRYRSLYSPSVQMENRCHTLTACAIRSQISCHLSMNCKMIREAVNTAPPTFWSSHCTFMERLFCVKRLKFSSDQLETSRCSIHSLSLLRKNDSLSKFEARNLYESIKRNFTQFFRCFYYQHVLWMKCIFFCY